MTISLGTASFTPAFADVAAPAAPAPPAPTPATSDEAKSAWIDAAHGMEALNQNVLLAQQAVATAEANATAAAAAADATVGAITAADAQVAVADAGLAGYRIKLDAVANASLRGARMSQLSSLLTAQSPQDYLDEVSALDQVAGDTLQTMSAAKAAKDVADQAKAAAEAARSAAQHAAADAQQAITTAQDAATDLVIQQQAMTAQITTYERLYTSLSVSERGEAIEQFANSNLSPEAQARLAQQASARVDAGITDAQIATDITDLSVLQAPDTAAGIAVAAALTRRGMPYVWGAVGPDSFDCSGLMLWAWEQAGITIPRTSSEQSTMPEVALDQLQPGDLVTFYAPVTHVGMYLGNGLVLHASMPGVPLTVVPLDKAGPSPSGHRVPR